MYFALIADWELLPGDLLSFIRKKNCSESVSKIYYFLSLFLQLWFVLCCYFRCEWIVRECFFKNYSLNGLFENPKWLRKPPFDFLKTLYISVSFVTPLEFKLSCFVAHFYNVVYLSTFICLFLAWSFITVINIQPPSFCLWNAGIWMQYSLHNKDRSVTIIYFSNYSKFVIMQIIWTSVK